MKMNYVEDEEIRRKTKHYQIELHAKIKLLRNYGLPEKNGGIVTNQ